MKYWFLLLVLCVLAKGNAQVSQDSLLAVKMQEEMKLQEAKAALAVFEAEHGHFIQTKNTKLHYLTFGDPKGVPLVWSPGSYMNAYEILLFAEDLVKWGYYVIACEYYGQGLTGVPSGDFSVWHYADDVKAILDELKIKKAIIGGWSRGGTMTTAFYDAYPERVLALILEDGGSVAWNLNDHKTEVDQIRDNTLKRFADEKPDATYDSESALFATVKAKNGTLFSYFMLNQMKQKEGKWGMCLGLKELVSEDNADHKLKITLRTMDAPMYAASAQLVNPLIIYRNLDVPMLIFDPVSEKDDFNFKEANEKLQKMYPDLIEHKIYESTGHAVKFEKRATFLKDMGIFLEKVKVFHKLK